MEAIMYSNQQLSASRKVNSAITKRIIELHKRGYVYDFVVKDTFELVCLQNDLRFINRETLIKLIDLNYDEVTHGFSYIHSVDTFCGYKGLLLSDHILCNNNWQ